MMQRYNTIRALAFPALWCQVTQGEILDLLKSQEVFTPESIEFQAKLLERSGTGQATHWPPSILQILRPELAQRRDEQGQPIVDGKVDVSMDGESTPGAGVAAGRDNGVGVARGRATCVCGGAAGEGGRASAGMRASYISQGHPLCSLGRTV